MATEKSSFNVFEKMNVKSNMKASGCNIAHAIPKKVCLYLTLISRQVKK